MDNKEKILNYCKPSFSKRTEAGMRIPAILSNTRYPALTSDYTLLSDEQKGELKKSLEKYKEKEEYDPFVSGKYPPIVFKPVTESIIINDGISLPKDNEFLNTLNTILK